MHDPTQTEPLAAEERCPVRSPWLRRLGAAAFLFFLIKGLLWLIVPGALAYWAMNK